MALSYRIRRFVVIHIISVHRVSLTLGVHALEGYSSWSVCLSVCVCVCVCVFVTTFSATTRNKPGKKIYQQVQRYTGFIFKMVIFAKILRAKVMA